MIGVILCNILAFYGYFYALKCFQFLYSSINEPHFTDILLEHNLSLQLHCLHCCLNFLNLIAGTSCSYLSQILILYFCGCQDVSFMTHVTGRIVRALPSINLHFGIAAHIMFSMQTKAELTCNLFPFHNQLSGS